MKKTNVLLAVLILLSALNMKAIETQDFLTKTQDTKELVSTDLVSQVVVEKNYGPNERYTYTYEENGKLHTQLVALWQGEQWINTSRKSYTYDASGNLLNNLTETFLNGEWIGVSRILYDYDAQNNIINELYENCANGVWVSLYKYTQTYDEKGNLLTEL